MPCTAGRSHGALSLIEVPSVSRSPRFPLEKRFDARFVVAHFLIEFSSPGTIWQRRASPKHKCTSRSEFCKTALRIIGRATRFSHGHRCRPVWKAIRKRSGHSTRWREWAASRTSSVTTKRPGNPFFATVRRKVLKAVDSIRYSCTTTPLPAFIAAEPSAACSGSSGLSHVK